MNRETLTPVAGYGRGASGLRAGTASETATHRLEELLLANRIAMKVWELLDGVTSVAEIAQVVASEFQIARDQAFIETRGFIRMFSEAELLRVTH